MAGGLRKPEEGVLLWEFVLVLWAAAVDEEEEEFSKAKGIFLQQQGAESFDMVTHDCPKSKECYQKHFCQEHSRHKD